MTNTTSRTTATGAAAEAEERALRMLAVADRAAVLATLARTPGKLAQQTRAAVLRLDKGGVA